MAKGMKDKHLLKSWKAGETESFGKLRNVRTIVVTVVAH